MAFRPFILTLVLAVAAFSQVPAIEPGVSHDLAKWRAARYSNVRYKLNLTLEKMSPVLKGSMEIRVKVSAGTQAPSPANAGSSGVTGIPIILDWRRIKGHEEKSTISNVSLNGVVLSVSPLLTRGLSQPGAQVGSGGATYLFSQAGDKSAQARASARAIADRGYDETNEHLIFRDGVVLGENVIKLDFTSPILASGSAITRYIDKEDGSEYIYSLFVPSDASTAFPVFDQPDLKAMFSLYVRRPADWKIVTNGKSAGALTLTSGYTDPIDWYEETKPISTYVFAFAAGPFQEFTDAGDKGGNLSGSEGAQPGPSPNSRTLPTGRVSASTVDLSSRICVRKSQAKKFEPHSKEVFRLNREGIKFLETYFDYKFPFPKYDLVLIPEFPFGGMEHAGATFLRESAIIFPQEPTRGDHISRANLIFHEAAHQWFGDTVTMKWFDDLWLKEGFAEFMAYKTLERVMPEANAWKVFYERNKQAAYLTDSTKGTTPIYQPIANLNSAKSAYGNIVYRKAPSFLKQAEFYIGPDKFQTAVRAFLKKHEYANAEWNALVDEFANAEIQSVTNAEFLKSPDYPRWKQSSIDSKKEWAENWVMRPGLPVVRYEPARLTYRDVPGSSMDGYAITQDSRIGFRWRQRIEAISINVGGKRTKNNWVWISTQTDTYTEVPPNTSFFFPNSGDYGYGIFLLDDKSREYVLKNIHSEKDAFLRSMMWGSLWDSVREGELDPKVYVELVIRQLGGPTSQGNDQIAKARASARAIAKGGTTETDETIVASLVGRVSLALNYYMPSPDIALADARSSATEQLRSQFEAVLLDRMRRAPTAGQRITFFRAFVNNASTDKGREMLKEMLRNQGGNPSSSEGAQRDTRPNSRTLPTGRVSASDTAVPLKAKDKFDIVMRLAVLGDADAVKLLAELEKTETSDDAKRYAYAARAGFATAENKAKYWNDFVNNAGLSESWIEAAFGPWNSIRHTELTLPYLERALKELPNHKRGRKIFFVNGWLAAFIGGQRDEKALAIVNKFLADNPSLDNDLRLKILENVDLIERAVRIRARYGKGQPQRTQR